MFPVFTKLSKLAAGCSFFFSVQSVIYFLIYLSTRVPISKNTAISFWVSNWSLGPFTYFVLLANNIHCLCSTPWFCQLTSSLSDSLVLRTWITLSLVTIETQAANTTAAAMINTLEEYVQQHMHRTVLPCLNGENGGEKVRQQREKVKAERGESR